jgi:hypothetical protein
MRDRRAAPSPALLSAQRRLEQLRASSRAGQLQGPRCAEPNTDPPADRTRPGLAHYVGQLPLHLGWSSAPGAALIRRSVPAGQAAGRRDLVVPRAAPASAALSAGPAGSEDFQPTKASDGSVADGSVTAGTVTEAKVKLYPDLALAMLGHNQTATGRLWLLLHHLDGAGRGWLRIDRVQQQLTSKESPLRLCGRRQLRHLLRQGQDLFWQRDRERIWLRSAAKVALALQTGRLRQRPVALPVSVLLQGMGTVRAHLYASFHSGRRRTAPSRADGPISMAGPISGAGPISRRRLAQLSHVPERTQRHYDRVANVTVTANLAVGPRLEAAAAQECAWRHGRSTFVFTDSRGRQGPRGRRYLAWRLPNSYRGPHQSCSQGRKRKINWQIDLVTSGAQGNGLPEDRRNAGREGLWPVDGRGAGPALEEHRLFHPHGQAAARAFRPAGRRANRRDIYWPQAAARRNGRALWHVIPGKEKVPLRR